MANQHTAELDTLFRSLADPTRRAVVARLTQGAAPVSTLAEPFDMALPSFLKHLKLLEDGGLIVTRKEGRTRICELRPERLAAATDWLDHQRQMWTDRFDRLDALVLSLPKDPTR